MENVIKEGDEPVGTSQRCRGEFVASHQPRLILYGTPERLQSSVHWGHQVLPRNSKIENRPDKARTDACRVGRKAVYFVAWGLYPQSPVRFGRLTQRLECHLHTVEVTGSNPVSPIRCKYMLDRRLRSLVRRNRCEAGLITLIHSRFLQRQTL